MARNIPHSVRPGRPFFDADGPLPERERGWLWVAGLVLVALVVLAARKGAMAPGPHEPEPALLAPAS